MFTRERTFGTTTV
jgi:hypothetical protein